MGLERYHEKRDFERTPEPIGEMAAGQGWSFVIQKHAARRLHYDFRLELDGVLLSWAVPKGPSLDPGTRRLAVRTEDHPLDYAEFEGVIPKGEYGGGTVIVWDRGRWTPVGDPRQGLQRGRLTFALEGEKLRGLWHLVKTGGEDNSWLLIKSSKDDAAEREEEGITDRAPSSVLSRRTLEEVGEAPERVWHSKSGDGHEAGEWRPPVRLTNPNKVLWPEARVTKFALARYYADIAELMLPHLSDRPLTLVRCPEGQAKGCFYQKVAHPPLPEGVHPIEVPEGFGGSGTYMYVDSVEGLLGLVQLGVLEIHVWGSRRDKLERPDQIVIDLDPDPELGWNAVVDAAFMVKEKLEDLGLVSFLKTTGGKGLHVVVPLVRRSDWEEVRAFSHALVRQLEAEHPERYVTTLSKKKRKGRIFLDYLRNGRGATAICVYSTRRRPRAPVAAPVTWDELGPKLRPDQHSVETLPRYLASLGRDPWEGYFDVKQSITKQMRRSLGLE